MKTFDLINLAENAASRYFEQQYGHSGNIGIERKAQQPNGCTIYEFYSKDDPGMDDTYVCLVEDQRPHAQIIVEGQIYEYRG